MEVMEDFYSISSGEGDNHMTDVWEAFGLCLVFGAGIGAWFWGVAGSDRYVWEAIPIQLIIYFSMRLAFFNRWLNSELGLPSDYLSDRGWDNLYSRVPLKLRKPLELLVVALAILASYGLWHNIC
jgi:hypothetical protein